MIEEEQWYRLMTEAKAALDRSLNDGKAHGYTTEWLHQTPGQHLAHAHVHMDELVIALRMDDMLNPFVLEDLDHAICRLVMLKYVLTAK
jgi:hypothetical protein